jgi:membrane protein YqaA with SNARE-associated domain
LDLLLLFAASLLAATIVPAQSEAVLAGLALAGNHSLVVLVAVATLGNVLGACINWLLGRYLEHFKNKRWFPVKEAALDKAARTYQRYGVWSLLLSWVPIIGDPLTVIAGLLRTPFPLFVLLVTIGKLARYVAVVSVF